MKVIIAALAVLLPCAAYAQACAPHSFVVVQLSQRYGETRQMVGLNTSGEMIEVYANADTGTWTLLVTDAAMMTCLPDGGADYEATPANAAPMGDDG